MAGAGRELFNERPSATCQPSQAPHAGRHYDGSRHEDTVCLGVLSSAWHGLVRASPGTATTCRLHLAEYRRHRAVAYIHAPDGAAPPRYGNAGPHYDARNHGPLPGRQDLRISGRLGNADGLHGRNCDNSGYLRVRFRSRSGNRDSLLLRSRPGILADPGRADCHK